MGTAKGEANMIVAAAFPGDLNGQIICDEGECCTDFYGQYAYFGGAEEDTWAKDSAEEEINTGVCSDEVTHGHYCMIMEMWATRSCFESFISQASRFNDRIIPCYD